MRSFLFFILALISIDASFACPRISKLIDYNCDQQIKIAATGDSIVKGVGGLPDEEGYIARLRERLPNATITNLGIAGITSHRLLRAFKKNLSKTEEGETKIKTHDADVILIDVGRNDFYEDALPSLTVQNIRRIVKYLKQKIGDDVQTPPEIIVSTLLPTSRRFQAPFINEVNRLLLKLNSPDFRVLIRFDLLSTDLLSEDGLHPSAEGYIEIGNYLYRVIKKSIQQVLKPHAKDTDKDGIADYFEANRYYTNELVSDSDIDGFSDGDEVFKFGTDPLDSLSHP